ncbi:MAG: O-antigen ligase family protein [Salinivirgaceae bacterium]|nr:O-antigen ligase family protein [Salinivirgaceae bacterium]
MLKNINKWWAYGGAIIFVLLNAFFIYKEFFYFSLIPIVLLLVVAAFLALDKLLLALVFMVPLSVPLSEFGLNLPIDMFLPTEPLLAGILLIFILKLIFEGNFDHKVLVHPVSISIYLYLTWMLVTTITSTMPLVSIKYMASKLWFLTAFYFLATQLFKNKANAQRYYSYYVYGLVIVVFYALYRHATYGIFQEKIAHWSANPFYKDHTSYGAILAFFIPPVATMTFIKVSSARKKFAFGTILFILSMGLIFSYSRAAWLSLLGAFGLWAIIKLRIKLWVVLTSIVTVGIIVLFVAPNLSRSLKSNKQDSSTDLAKHVQSMSNITTDASNLERFNRWNCAIRMFKEKPVFGWGPGTYMFQYAPFQISSEKTIISTNQGDGGNAHSEYLGPLSEQGVLGTVLFIAIIISTLITGFRAIKNCPSYELRSLGLAAILGLSTYYAHGILNNFLDTDKISAPFWGFTALLVAIDIYHSNKEVKEN